jgi:hypothetical protein
LLGLVASSYVFWCVVASWFYEKTGGWFKTFLAMVAAELAESAATEATIADALGNLIVK